MIDWQRINELKSEVGEEDFEEIATLFLEEVDGAIETLSADVSPEQLSADLHFLKGCALTLGFEALANLCRDGEKAANAGDTSQIDTDEICRTYQVSRQTF